MSSQRDQHTPAQHRQTSVPQQAVLEPTATQAAGTSATVARQLPYRPSADSINRIPRKPVPSHSLETSHSQVSASSTAPQSPPPSYRSPTPASVASKSDREEESTASSLRLNLRKAKKDKELKTPESIIPEVDQEVEAGSKPPIEPAPIKPTQQPQEPPQPETPKAQPKAILPSTRGQIHPLEESQAQGEKTSPQSHTVTSRNVSSPVPQAQSSSAPAPPQYQQTGTTSETGAMSNPRGQGSHLASAAGRPRTRDATAPRSDPHQSTGSNAHARGTTGQMSANMRGQVSRTTAGFSNATDASFQWASHQSPCAAALCALGFLLIIFLCCVIGTTSIFMLKTHSSWIQGQDVTLCGLENSVLQDPTAHLYMWWMVASILLFMVLLFYNAVAWAWYVVKQNKAPVERLKEWSKKHSTKKIAEKVANETRHTDAAVYQGQRARFEEEGVYYNGQVT